MLYRRGGAGAREEEKSTTHETCKYLGAKSIKNVFVGGLSMTAPADCDAFPGLAPPGGNIMLAVADRASPGSLHLLVFISPGWLHPAYRVLFLFNFV